MFSRKNAGIIVAGLVLLFVAGLAAQSVEDQNTALLKKFYNEVVNQGNIDLIDDLLADNFTEHEMLPGDMAPGRQGVKEFFTMYRQGFPI